MSRRRLYDRVAEQTASVIIRRYSTSFGLASRLLSGPVRQHVANIYALVRVADEIVDGAAVECGLNTDEVARQLDELERQTAAAMLEGFSSNLVVHAFALTAKEAGFGTEYTAPFFSSMRADLTETRHDQQSFDRYVHGSAEVVTVRSVAAASSIANATRWSCAPSASGYGAAPSPRTQAAIACSNAAVAISSSLNRRPTYGLPNTTSPPNAMWSVSKPCRSRSCPVCRRTSGERTIVRGAVSRTISSSCSSP